MHHVFKLAPLPLLAGLFIACSAGVETDPVEGDPAAAGDQELAADGEVALALESGEGEVVDKGRRGHDDRRHRGHRHHRRWRHHHEPRPRPQPPAEPPVVPPGQACEVAGQTFPDGSEVPSGDSCNTCTCSDGNVGCTRAICGPTKRSSRRRSPIAARTRRRRCTRAPS